VIVDGARVGTVGLGDLVGEIALLRDVPRTATVVARTPVVALALARASFLAAMTGHAESRDAAEAIAASRLGDRRTALGSL
jgi:CRP-like cAMP-binding protein